MGANSSKSLENVTSEINNELAQLSQSSAVTDCSINVGNITFNDAQNCTITNTNRCVSNSSSALNAIATAAANAFQTASTAQKTQLIPGINVNESSQNIQQYITQELNQKCQANSSTTQSIATGNINFDECVDSNIINVNAGSAVANCGIKTILQAVETQQQNASSNQSTASLASGIGLPNLTTTMIGIGAAICLCLIICIVLIIIIIVFMK